MRHGYRAVRSLWPQQRVTHGSEKAVVCVFKFTSTSKKICPGSKRTFVFKRIIDSSEDGHSKTLKELQQARRGKDKISHLESGIMEEGAQLPLGFAFKDGSIHRLPTASLRPEVPSNPEFVNGVASKDVMLYPERNLWVRIYKPQVETKPQPILLYFHGGGFLYCTPSVDFFHKICEEICKQVNIVIVSVNYRLAPEHRLPAAYEDGFSALKWIESCLNKQTSEAWLEDADSSRVYVAGDSAGGNLAHHVTLGAVQQPESLSFELAGQILLQPYFGGVSRTESELKLADGALFTLSGSDLCWELALPDGESRDHEFSNPGLKLGEKAAKGFIAKTLVVAGGLDHLHDRQVEYVNILKATGANVKLVFFEKAGHGFYTTDCKETELLLEEIAKFCS